jgi:hypothetical protein
MRDVPELRNSPDLNARRVVLLISCSYMSTPAHGQLSPAGREAKTKDFVELRLYFSNILRTRNVA